MVRLRGRALDRLIADGRDAHTQLVALRSAWLVRRETRAALAANWNRLLTPRRLTLAPINRKAIELAHPDLVELVELLRSDRPVTSRGIASAELLLTDGTGPLYRHASPEQLVIEIRAVLRALAR